MEKVSNNRSRLLFLLHNFHNRAGTEEHTKLLGTLLRDEFEVAYLFPQGNQLVLRFEDNGNETLFAGAQMPWPLPPVQDETITRSLKQIFSLYSPDLIHIQHIFNWPLGIIDQLSQFGRPLLMSFHEYFAITPFFTMQGTEDPKVGLSEQYVRAVFGQDIRKQLFGRIQFLKNAFQSLRVRVVPSRFLASVLQELYPGSYAVIPHGIRGFSRAVTRYTGENLRFGFVGSILPQKGWMELLRAWPLVTNDFPKAELHLYGGGGLPPAEYPRGVTFRGVYEQSQLPELLSDFHVGVIPSVFAETFSLVLSEMQLAGLPVATSNLGVFRERIIPGQTGVLFDPFDQFALAESLRSFLSSNQWRQWAIPTPRLAEEMKADYIALYSSLL